MRCEANQQAKSHWPKHRTMCGTLLVVMLAGAAGHAQSTTTRVWKSSAFLDFVDGTFADSANSYLTAEGELVLINRLDLDGDGHSDIVLPNDHDPNQRADLFIYWGGDAYSSERRLQLPTNGGSDSAVADLNGDGHLDLVVANNFNGTRTDLDSYVYWGGPQGLDPARRSNLPTLGARAVALADLNQDGYVDVVFANSGLGYHVTVDRANRSFVYWGAADGYHSERRLELKTINGRDVVIHDLDRDGQLDLVFANEGNTDEDGGALIYWGSKGGDYLTRRPTHLPGERSSAVAVADLNGDQIAEIVLANAYRLQSRELGMYNIIDTVRVASTVYWGSPAGYAVDSRTSLPTVAAADVGVGDLNRDGHPELVFANKTGGASYIYWGALDGYRSYRRTALPTRSPSRLVVEDLNADGHLDLAFAQTQADHHQKPAAYVYWGGEQGFAQDRRTELPTLQASGIQAADLNADGQQDLVLVNAGDSSFPIPSYIYWGDGQRGFSAARRQVLPSGGSYYAAADVNRDGHQDLVFASIHDDEHGSGIYWGSPHGFSADNRRLLDSQGAFCVRLGDFNRDGYLDVLLGQWQAGQQGSSLYFGGPEGLTRDSRFVFQIGGVRGHAVADFDRNGWLDVVFGTTNNQVVIYWNSELGFDNGRQTSLASRVCVSVETADLNRDGWLDLIVSNLFDAQPAAGKAQSFGGSPQGDTFIYWGSSQGYHASRRQVLPSVGNADAAVADLNGNGLLDVVLSNYHAGFTRSAPSTIYWNSGSGFAAERATRLPTNSASGVLVNDFDRDGHADILFACHTKQGNHRNDSFLYWGSPQGYSPDRRKLLPGVGPHHITCDSGQSYDRGDRYDYVSPPFNAGPKARFEAIEGSGETPFQTNLQFQLRTAGTRAGLESAEWFGPRGKNTFYGLPGGSITPLAAGDWIQYKVTLISPTSTSSPVLRSVSIRYR